MPSWSDHALIHLMHPSYALINPNLDMSAIATSSTRWSRVARLTYPRECNVHLHGNRAAYNAYVKRMVRSELAGRSEHVRSPDDENARVALMAPDSSFREIARRMACSLMAI